MFCGSCFVAIGSWKLEFFSLKSNYTKSFLENPIEEDGKVSLYCDGQYLRFASMVHIDRKRTAWIQQVILNQGNDTLAVFKRGEKSEVFEYQSKMGDNYLEK